MAAISIDQGNGSTVYPISLQNPETTTQGQAQSSDWWRRRVSQYNTPTPVALPSTTARQVSEQSLTEDQGFWGGRESAKQSWRGPLGQFLVDVIYNVNDVLAAPLPQTQKVGPAAVDVLKSESPSPIPNPPSFREPSINYRPISEGPPPGNWPLAWDPVIGTNFDGTPITVGYQRKIPLQDTKADSDYIKSGVKPSVVTSEEVSAAMQNATSSRRPPDVVSIYDEINALDQAYGDARTRAAIRLYGDPMEVTNPDGSKRLQWGTNGAAYLGMTPGSVPSFALDAPSQDAPYKKWVQYRDRLKAQRANLETLKLYTEADVDNELWNMGTKGLGQLQTQFRDARLYKENDYITRGQISESEREIMKALMTRANLNGLTWQEQLEIEKQKAAEAKKAGSGGSSVFTQIQYSQTSMAQGRALLISILTDAIGRYPTDEEVAKFIDMLNKAESKSPTTTVTRTSGNRSVTRSTPSTVDPNAMAQEFAQEIGGGAPYEANKRDNYLMGYLQSLGGTLG